MKETTERQKEMIDPLGHNITGVENLLHFSSLGIEERTDKEAKYVFKDISLIKGAAPVLGRKIDKLEVHTPTSFKAHVVMQAYTKHLSGQTEDKAYTSALLESASVIIGSEDETGCRNVYIYPWNEQKSEYGKAIKVRVTKEELEQIEKLTGKAPRRDPNFDYKKEGKFFKTIEEAAKKPVDQQLTTDEQAAVQAYGEFFGIDTKDITRTEALYQKLCEKARGSFTFKEKDQEPYTKEDKEGFEALINKLIKLRENDSWFDRRDHHSHVAELKEDPSGDPLSESEQKHVLAYTKLFGSDWFKEEEVKRLTKGELFRALCERAKTCFYGATAKIAMENRAGFELIVAEAMWRKQTDPQFDYRGIYEDEAHKAFGAHFYGIKRYVDGDSTDPEKIKEHILAYKKIFRVDWFKKEELEEITKDILAEMLCEKAKECIPDQGIVFGEFSLQIFAQLVDKALEKP